MFLQVSYRQLETASHQPPVSTPELLSLFSRITMEPTGLVVGVAGLAGAFTACVDCFEYIQLGRRFGQDYGKCLLKLDAEKLRLSRWGVAMGLGPQPSLKPQPLISKGDFEVARRLLEQIMDSFGKAERVSERFRKHSMMQKKGTEDLVVYDAGSSLDPSYQRLHLTLSELANQRQNRTSLLKKTTWALYEKKRFDSMIADVTVFIRELVELFPATQEHQRALCKAEVSAVSEIQDLALLNEITGDDNTMLAAEVKKEIDSHGHNVTDWEARDGAEVWIGDENVNAIGVRSSGHKAARFTVSGNAHVHIGNRVINRGR